MSLENKRDLVLDDDYIDEELPDTVDDYDDYTDDDLPETSGGEPEKGPSYIPIYNADDEVKREPTARPYANYTHTDNKKPCPYCTTPISKEECVPFFRSTFDMLSRYVSSEVLSRSQHMSEMVYRRHFFGDHADETSVVNVPEGLFLFPEVEAMLDANTSYNRTTRCLHGSEGTMPLAASEPVACRHCGQFIPREFWDLDCVGIALYGSAKVGKTAYVCSLLNNNCEQLSRGVKNFAENLLTGTMVGIQQVTDKALEGWAAGKMPPATNEKLPPIFIKIKWPAEKANGKPYTQLLYIIDQSGEDATNAKKTATTILSQCDGILYLIDPIQFPHWQNEYMPEGSGEYAGMPDDDADASVPVNNVAADVSQTEREEEIPSPLESYQRLVAIPGMKGESCAVVITKIDRVFNNAGDLSVDRSELEKVSCIETVSPKYRHPFIPGVVYDFEEEPFYEKATNDLFEMTRYPLEDIAALFPDKTKYFVCSAVGCEPISRKHNDTNELYFDYNKLNPIHVSDPIIWLLMEKRRKANKNKKNN